MSIAMKRLRNKRNELLAECDWTLLPSSPLSAEKQDEWKVYRQALRDLPSTASSDFINQVIDGSSPPVDMSSITWPTKPS